jgi:TRAP-type transport system small permease protein
MTGSTGQSPRSGAEYWLGDVPAKVLGVVACAMLFVMMMLTFVDVAGRYLFAAPLPAAYEMIAFVMPGIIFCALPHVNLQEGHVTIDLLDGFISKKIQRWQSFVVNMLSAIAVGFVAVQLWTRSRSHLRYEEVTDELYLELWIFSTTMSVLCGIAVIAFLVNAWGYAANTRQRHSMEDGVSPT